MKEYNYWAILVSAFVNLAIGFVWFTMLFRDAYIHDLGKTKAQMDQGPNAIEASVIQLVGFVVLSFVMAWLINGLGYTSLHQHIRLALILWCGFIVAIIGPMYAFQAYSFRLFLIIAVGYLLSILASAIILCIWKK